MKTRRISKLLMVALVVLFLTGGIVVAGSIKVTLEGEEMCRNLPPLVEGIVSTPDDRWHIRGEQALWDVYGGNELLDGSMVLVLNANMDGPPPFFERNGVAFGSFELVPDMYPEGSWVGTYNSHYENGIVKSSFIGLGTGELEGLKMKSYDEWIYNGVRCDRGRSRPFTVEIHDPKSEFF